MSQIEIFTKIGDVFVGKMSVLPETSNSILATPILILDISGSMSNHVAISLKKTQEGLLKLGYQEDEIVHVVTFSSKVSYHKLTIRTLTSSSIISEGTTYFTGVCKILNSILREGSCYNIVCISDGDIYDQETAMLEIDNLTKNILNKYTISVCCIRLFTSRNATPDTRVMTGILRLDNVNVNMIVENIGQIYKDAIRTDMDQIVKIISSRFKPINRTTITSNDPILLENPWSEPKNSINVTADSLIYLKSLGNIFTNSSVTTVTTTEKSYVSSINCLEPLFSKIDNTIRMLKIINTPETKLVLKSLKNFIDELISWEEIKNNEEINKEISNNNSSKNNSISKENLIFTLSNKRSIIKNTLKRGTKTVITQLQQLLNEDAIDKLNSNQKAEYLRSNITKNSKSSRLTRLVNTDHFDTDERIRLEVKNICMHLNELDDIDENALDVSFFSQEHLLDSLKQLPEILDQLENLEATDIFKLVNIVGIGIDIQISEYPDPKNLNIKNIYPNCYISMNDIILYHTMKKMSSNDVNFCDGIPVPGQEGHTINAVVPVFSDLRLLNFMLNNAPTMLEVFSSINIRRLNLDIPGTFYYTMANGANKIIGQIYQTNCQELCISTLLKMLPSLKINKYVKQYTNMLTKDNLLLHFNSFNGVSSCVVVTNALLCSDSLDKNTLAKIVKDTINFRLYHNVKSCINYKLNNNISDNNNNNNTDNDKRIRNNTINEILNISTKDLEKNLNYVTLFSDDPELVQYNKVFTKQEIDNLYNRCSISLNSIKYLVVLYLIKIYDNILDKDVIRNELEKINENDSRICELLNLDYSNHKLYAIHQLLIALMFGSQSQRLDLDNNKLLVPNFTKEEDATNYFNDYINQMYKEKHEQLIKRKHNLENQELYKILADNIIVSDNKHDICNYFKNGIKETVRDKQITVQFINQYSSQVDYLTENLLSEKITVPLRSYKLHILILGTDEYMNRIWNGENIIKTVKIKTIKPFFNDNEWVNFFDTYKIYKTYHKYRVSDKPNRHGFCNSNPSYYAIGYETIEEFISNATKDEIQEYIKRNPKSKKLLVS